MTRRVFVIYSDFGFIVIVVGLSHGLKELLQFISFGMRWVSFQMVSLVSYLPFTCVMPPLAFSLRLGSGGLRFYIILLLEHFGILDFN